MLYNLWILRIVKFESKRKENRSKYIYNPIQRSDSTIFDEYKSYAETKER